MNLKQSLISATLSLTTSALLQLVVSLFLVPNSYHYYSIEEAKQKAEYDRKVKQAEEKKQHVRRLIASLRRSFVKLQEENRKLPEHLQLVADEFVMDPDMYTMHSRDTEEKVEILHKEMSWERERHRLAYEKISAK